MNLRVFTAAVLALAIPAGALAQDGTQKDAKGPKPSIDIPRIRYDFGRIFEAPSYNCSFVVRNRGAGDLVIQDVKPSCGCTTTRFDKMISPGQEGKIDLSIDGARVFGEFDKSATVFSNDPEHPELTISVVGSEVPYVKFSPEGTVYLHGHYGEAIDKDVDIASNETGTDFQVTGVTSDLDDKISYQLAPGANKGEYTLHIHKNPKLPVMSIYGALKVRTNSKNAPEAELKVHVMTMATISAMPTTLNFGALRFASKGSPGTPSTKSVVVSKSTGKFRIKGVTVSNPAFAVSVQPVIEGQQYRIQVTFTPPIKQAVGQSETAELVVNTDDPQESSVRVQVIARSL